MELSRRALFRLLLTRSSYSSTIDILADPSEIGSFSNATKHENSMRYLSEANNDATLHVVKIKKKNVTSEFCVI